MNVGHLKMNNYVHKTILNCAITLAIVPPFVKYIVDPRKYSNRILPQHDRRNVGTELTWSKLT